MDRLAEMFERQKQLQAMALGIITPVDNAELSFLSMSACMVEIGEAIQCDSRWKHMLGGKRKDACDSAAKLEELVDAQHFLINAVLLSGFDVNEFFSKFIAKNDLNKKRQTSVER